MLPPVRQAPGSVWRSGGIGLAALGVAGRRRTRWVIRTHPWISSGHRRPRHRQSLRCDSECGAAAAEGGEGEGSEDEGGVGAAVRNSADEAVHGVASPVELVESWFEQNVEFFQEALVLEPWPLA